MGPCPLSRDALTAVLLFLNDDVVFLAGVPVTGEEPHGD